MKTLLFVITVAQMLFLTAMAHKKKLTLGFLCPWERGWLAGPGAGGALPVALEEVKRRQLLPEYDIQWIHR